MEVGRPVSDPAIIPKNGSAAIRTICQFLEVVFSSWWSGKIPKNGNSTIRQNSKKWKLNDPAKFHFLEDGWIASFWKIRKWKKLEGGFGFHLLEAQGDFQDLEARPWARDFQDLEGQGDSKMGRGPGFRGLLATTPSFVLTIFSVFRQAA